jgi:hypothetical protein
MKNAWAAILLLLVLLVLPAAAAGAPSVASIPASGTYVVNADRVNVRDAPDVQAGKVIAQLNKGAVVKVLGMTKLVYEVNGTIAAWFHLETPDGWIFGWYLDAAE